MKKSARDKCLSAFQRLRVLQESSNGFAKCISCGKIYPVDQMDGGHYVSRTHRSTEILPMNVHAQCRKCNRFLNGDLISYRQSLAQKYGEEEVEKLEAMRYQTLKRSEQEYKELAKEFSEEAKKLQV